MQREVVVQATLLSSFFFKEPLQQFSKPDKDSFAVINGRRERLADMCAANTYTVCTEQW